MLKAMGKLPGHASRLCTRPFKIPLSHPTEKARQQPKIPATPGIFFHCHMLPDKISAFSAVCCKEPEETAAGLGLATKFASPLRG